MRKTLLFVKAKMKNTKQSFKPENNKECMAIC